MVHGYGGYTTNVPLEDLLDGKAWIAYQFDGEPLAPEHGGPARLLVPHLYFWKSAKWVNGIEMMQPGRAGLLGSRRLPHVRRPMARAALPGRLSLAAAADASSRGRRVGRRRRPARWCCDVPDWPGHLPGQHVDVRLTAPDGYSRPAQLLDRLGLAATAARSS